MKRIETKDELKLTSSDQQIFQRGLLAYYGAIVAGIDPVGYLPRGAFFSAFAEETEEGKFLGVVVNGRAALIQMTAETVRAILGETNERTA